MFQDQWIDTVTMFIKEELAGKARYFDINEQFPERLYYKLVKEIGIFELLRQDEEGRDNLRTFIEILRLLSTEFASLASIIAAQAIYAIWPLTQYGTVQQKQSFLEKCLSGQEFIAFAFSEEGVNLQNRLPQTTARQTEDGWILTGDKYMVTNISLATRVLVLAQTVDLYGEKGTGIFIVDCQKKGIEIGKLLEKEGLRSMPLAPISFEQVHLSQNSLLGESLSGMTQWEEILLKMRLAISAQSLGIAQGIFERGIADSQIRRSFGKRPIDVQLNQQKFAELLAQLTSCESYYRFYMESDLTNASQVALLKLMTSRLSIEVADEVARITGLYSFTSENDIERYVRDAHVVSLYGGSVDNLKLMVAQQWL